MFQKIEPASIANEAGGNRANDEEKKDKDINKEVWQVNQERANEYFKDMRTKLES